MLFRRRTAVSLSALATAANQLGPGQSIKFADLPEALLEFGAENADFIKYGSSGVWDPVRKQARFIGRRQSNGFAYHGLVYTESSDEWANDFPLWSTDTVPSGHGYDHNAINPANGHHFFRVYNSNEVYEEDGAGNWAQLPALLAGWQIAGGLTYVLGVGLLYNDRNTLQLLTDGAGAWVEIEDLGIDVQAYHTVSQYNPIAELMVFGAGNADKALKSMDLDQVLADIPTPAIELGSSEDQGVFTHDPNSDEFFGWQKATSSWQAWGPGDLSWRNLTQSSGNGSSPQNGPPNLDTSATGRPCIAIPIPAHDGMDHGVTMWIQSLGGAGHTWLYRHS